MEMLEHTPDVLTIPEAAETLKLSVSAIQSLVDNGEIEHLEIAGQTLIFKLFLVNYIEKLRIFRHSRKEMPRWQNTKSINLL